MAEDWFAANYEDNPLDATKSFHHDDAYLMEFQRVADFVSSEELRESIPQPSDPGVIEGCPEGLESWLGEHRRFLSGLQDDRLKACAPLAGLFLRGHRGDGYASVLTQLLKLEAGKSRPAIVPDVFPEWIGQLETTQVAAIAKTCEQNAGNWVAAAFEGSPLEVVRPFAAEPSSGESFRIRLERFSAAESVRQALIEERNAGVFISDPEPLEIWLQTSAHLLEQTLAVIADSIPQLLPVEEQGAYCSQYEVVLRAWLDLGTAMITSETVIPPMETILVQCDEVRSGRIINECTRVASAWLQVPLDALFLGSIAVFPPDDAGLNVLQVAITRFVDAVRKWDELARLKDSSGEMGDSELLRLWLADAERVLSPADPATFVDAAGWVRHFYRSDASGDTLAQELYKKLDGLRTTMQSLAAHADDRDLATGAAALELNQLDKLSKYTSRLAEAPEHGFGLKRLGARCRLWWLLRLQSSERPRFCEAIRSHFPSRAGTSTNATGDRRYSPCAGYRDPELKLGGTEEQTRETIDRLAKAYLVCKVIGKCPSKVGKGVQLRGADRDTVLQCVQRLRTLLEAHDAECATKKALEPLKSFMSEDWVENQVQALASGRVAASQCDQLTDMIAKLPELRNSASLCLTLGGLRSPHAKSSGMPRTCSELAGIAAGRSMLIRVQSIIRSHAISARKRRLEEISPVLWGLPTARFGKTPGPSATSWRL